MHAEVGPEELSPAAHRAAQAQSAKTEPCASSPGASRSGGARSCRARAGRGWARAPGRTWESDLTPRPRRAAPAVLRGRRKILSPRFRASGRRVPEEPVRVVEVDEHDAPRLRRARRDERHRFRNEGMRDLGDRAAGQLVGGEERAVDERRERRVGEKVRELAVPLFPLVDVGKPEHACGPVREPGTRRCRNPRRGAARG